MKRFLAVSALTLSIAASSAFALVGGPWDANVYGNANPVDPSNVNGVYQGSVKGKNISGVTAFASSTIGTTGQAGYTETVTTGTGNNQHTVTTTFASTVQGYAAIYIEGKLTYASLVVSVDLGARKISGVMEGAGSRAIPLVLHSPLHSWNVTDSAYFTGNFNAKLSSRWAANSYSGKGTLMITKVDLDGFYRAVLTSPASATPQIVTEATSIKLDGVKTSNSATTSYTVTINPVPPVVSLIN
ncbi:MAG: hypothetical protein PHQ12_07160 [Chthoniobacteraceae bacterium]|nr:hypothetical protein [Chthoniobacteraceae bacterium]